MQPVRSLNQAIHNAIEFNSLSRDFNCITLHRFSQFFHWYYFSHLGIFAPSKFIGYVGTTLENYQGKGTGTVTQAALRKWFRKVSVNSPQFYSLRRELEKYAKSIGRQLSKKTFEGTGGIYLLRDEYAVGEFPDETNPGKYPEGATKRVIVNAYERNDKARSECIRHWGSKCNVCDFEFGFMYGEELGEGFIHVHHLKELASIGQEYVVDPIEDLRPLCPNCHAMVHRRTPALSLEELRKRLRKTPVRRTN